MNRLAFVALIATWTIAGCDSQPVDKGPAPEQAPQTTSARDREARSKGAESSFTAFESGQVRPLALSADGSMLFAVNTPDARLEVFAIQSDGRAARPERRASLPSRKSRDRGFRRHGARTVLSRVASVPVGLEPVAVAVRSQNEVWVVNHLSDSVSVVDISDLPSARVVRTLLVGDEPRDIVFGGPNRDRAFITTAHRGQNSPVDPQLTTPGVGRADVWVFDVNNLGDSLGGTPQTIITLFCDTPRALAVSSDGNTVYAAAFHSGNRTTTLPVGSVTAVGLPPPHTNHDGIAAPNTGLIVKFRQDPSDGQLHWLDELDRRWDSVVRLSLPDKDLFAIDAAADPPAPRVGSQSVFSGVGTVLFNMAVNPVSGKIYVSNTEAQNHNRFEGPGQFAGHTVRGHLAESQITVIDGENVLPRHLNHIDYNRAPEPTPNDQSVRSLATPNGMAVSTDGRTLYVAAFGSSKVGIFDTAQLESDAFVPDPSDHVVVSGGGPTGIVLNQGRGELYVLTRFDNSISVVDTAKRREIAHVPMFNPEPRSIIDGRRFLYDASFTSSNGEASCSSCHVFGDFDSLAWDLGNPDGDPLTNPGPFTIPPPTRPFHPMKGPMTTQSMRGMDNHGPMHWRGDRTGGNDAPSVQPDSGSFDEQAGFKKFVVAFEGLLGRSAPLSDEEMQAYTDFVLQIMYPPNPIRNLDNSLTPDQQAGKNFFMGPVSDTLLSCNGCHVLDPDGNRQFGVARPGFFGSDGRYSFENEVQDFKIPHLRNLYQKVGMFGMPPDAFFPVDANPFMGDQVRGFGFLHDGSVDTVFRFHGADVFRQRPANPGGIPNTPAGVTLRRQIESFMLAFDSNLAPIVGQQITLTQSNVEVASPRIDLLEARADVGECELVVKGFVDGQAAGFLYNGDGTFNRTGSGALVADAAVRAQRRAARR